MSYIITQNNITVFANGVAASIARSHKAAKSVIDLIRLGKLADALSHINQALALQSYVLSSGDIEFDATNETLTYKGKPINGCIVSRLLDMKEQDLSIKPMLKFLDNLMQNPSYRAITELYGFLEKSDLPITDDGHFLAYKRVRDDYTDCHSGTIDNHVGQVVSMPRQEVDDDSGKTCSKGLHAASLGYLKHFTGERLMVLKIDPADVVSIPADYNASKLRCCRYEVISEMPMPSDFTTLQDSWGPVYFTGNEEDEEDDDTEDYEDCDDSNEDEGDAEDHEDEETETE